MNKRHIRTILLVLILALFSTACAAEKNGEAAPSAGFADASGLVSQAQKLYDQEDYAGSLEIFLSAMETNARDIDARIGVVKSQIALGNESLALMNLEMLQQIAPDRVEICELYLQLSEQTGKIHYSHNAVDLAVRYGHDSILQLVPQEPVFALEGGHYDERIQVAIASPDPDAQIYVTVTNSLSSSAGQYDVLYQNPLRMLRGTNTVTAYTLRDGMPSGTVTMVYDVAYERQEVTFQEPLIEKLVRYKLNMDSGPITNYDCENIDELVWYELQDLYSDYWEYDKLRLHSLEDLKHLPMLEYLYLINQDEITDFSPLSYCPMLYQLDLSDCGLKNADLVRYCPNVEYLYLNDNDLTDISAVLELKNLQGLNLSRNSRRLDLMPILENCDDLYMLGINDDFLSDYGILKKLKSLENLNIYGISNLDYEGLSELTNLYMLQINLNYERREYNTTLKTLSFLQNMQSLEYLFINGVGNVSDLDYIRPLKKLNTLHMYNSPVTENSAAMESLAAALPNCNLDY